MINPSVISVVHSPISLRLCVSAREKGRGMGKLFWTSVIPSKKWQTTVRSNSFFRSLKLEITALRPTLSGSRMHRPPILGDYETLAELLPAAQPCGNIQRMSSSRVIPLTLVVAYTYTPSSRPGGMPLICRTYVYRGSWVDGGRGTEGWGLRSKV